MTATIVGPAPTVLDAQELRRAALLDAAATLFAQRGYHAANMRELGRMLGIKAGSLYYHFESKEQLLAQVCEIGLAALVADIESAVRSETSLVGRIDLIIRNHVALIHRYGTYLRVFERDQAHLPPDALVWTRERHVRYRHTIDEVFAEAKTRGELRSSVSEKSARYALLALLRDLSRIEADYPASELLVRAEGMRDILTFGLLRQSDCG